MTRNSRITFARISWPSIIENCYTPAHHHHQAGAEGASCTACHMPQRVYMVNDWRADHSMRVPRPDLSQSLDTPNACNGCHKDKSNEWAAAAVVA